MLNLRSLICLISSAYVAAESVIVSGYLWKDTSGNTIQAHGGGFLTVSVLLTSILCRTNIAIGRLDLLLVWRRQVLEQYTLQGGLLL